MKQIFVVLLLLFNGIMLSAQVRIAPVFSDNMVLQREVHIPLRGSAIKEKEITVTFKGKTYRSKVKQGKWQVNLPPTPAGGDYTIEIKGLNIVTLKNITFGDIWVCAGQSNMDSQISNYKENYPELYKGHPIPYEKNNIRIFKVERIGADVPQEYIRREANFKEGWSLLGPESVSAFTVTGYFFGLHLAEQVDVPIGLIQSCRGGTPITTWLPPGVLEKRKENTPFLERYKKAVKAWPEAKKEYDKKLKEWRSTYNPEGKGWWEQTPQARKMSPKMPDGPGNPNRMNAYHNAMIAPLYQLPVKGILWYQGEGSGGTVEKTKLYGQRLKDLVGSWRKNWNQAEMPFIVVQLPSFRKFSETPNTTDRRPWTREAQKRIEEVPNCLSICTIDSGLEADNHPPYKENVGKRLAYAVRYLVYGHKDVPLSPEYVSHIHHGESTVVTFKNYGSGLYVKEPQINMTNYKDGDVVGFIVADDSGIYHRVPGKVIASNKVKIDHPGINKPSSIRYAWEGFPNSNLFGEADMPVFPFRTDNHPIPSK
ncbi:MAG: hypothetical protein KTR30_18020 [Saprospiraceae bacterium]|nr:hypothetical protein [Saprospiraceae bacterium]